MKKEKFYSIGEIARLKLLKRHDGKPYVHRATLTSVLRGVPYTTKKTPWGDAKLYSQKTIDDLNSRWNN